MLSPRHLGSVSLGVCVSGMIASEALIHSGMLSNPWWSVMAMGFEAGTVGGMADWFAVSALFREVPIPILSRHTNIIVKNRGKITSNIVDMVQTKWLSPAIIGEKLSLFSFSNTMIEYVEKDAHKQQVTELAKDIISRLNDNIDDPKIASFLVTAIRDQLRDANIAMPLGKWLQGALKKGDHNGIWDALLSTLEKSLSSKEMRKTLKDLLSRLVEENAPRICENLTRSSALSSMESGIKSWLLSADLSAHAGRWLRDAINAERHQPIINVLTRKIGEHCTSDALKNEVKSMVLGSWNNYKEEHGFKAGLASFFRIVTDADLRDISNGFLKEIKTFAHKIDTDKSHPLREEIDKALMSVANGLIKDESTKEQFESFKQGLVEGADLKPLLKSIFSWLRDALVEGAKGNGGISIINFDQVSEILLEASQTIVKNVKNDKGHPIRIRVDSIIQDMADKLANGDGSMEKTIRDFQKSLIDNADFSDVIQSTLTKFKGTIDRQIKSTDSDLSNIISRFITKTIDNLKADPSARQRLDKWVSSTITSLVEKNHDMIGDMVRTSLSPKKITDKELVAQIEEKVGDDLQFIRLNGAIVGGMVGATITAVKLLI